MSEAQTALTVPVEVRTLAAAGDIYANPAAFTQMVRVAKMFATSPLVPEHLRKGTPETAVANCMICLVMARELGENPIVVMQNIHFVQGKFGWAAQYMIARANRSGKFKAPINWRIVGKGDSLRVTAYATLPSGEEVSAEASMAMAKAEGWVKNPKYTTMPEVMLRYRSAAFLVRFYCPEVMLGYHTAEELEDVRYTETTATVRIEPASTQQPETIAPPEPPWISALREAQGAYLAAHEGVMPDWLPDEVTDERQASQLIDRLHAETTLPEQAEPEPGSNG